MKKNIILVLSLSLATIMGCQNIKKESKTKKKIQFILSPKSGSNTNGTVLFTENDGQVTLELVMNRLSQGTHAIHIHEKADCSSEDGKSSGGHWNPTFENHGAWGSKDGYHKGDIGNFTADENGNGTITLTTNEWCIGCGDPTKDVLGKGLIVHQGADDFVTQPTGNSGARVACSAIIK